MDCTHTTISCGAETPFRALHLTDSHICRADARAVTLDGVPVLGDFVRLQDDGAQQARMDAGRAASWDSRVEEMCHILKEKGIWK